MKQTATFSERLADLLKAKNITRAELSRRTGIKPPSITHYMQGHWNPKQDTVTAISEAMNVNEKWLWGYDVPMEKFAPLKEDELSESDGAILSFLHSLPVDRVRGILLALGAPEGVLACFDREERRE